MGPPNMTIAQRQALTRVAACAVPVLVWVGLGLFELLRAGALHLGLEYDDGVWFGSALRLTQGAIPYRDFVLDQPPGVPLLLSPVALLAHATGTAGALEVARLLTVGVQAANIALVGRLLRDRSPACIAVACTVVAVYPAAVVTARTTMLEPYADLCCLLALVMAFEGGQLSQSRRRLLLAGAAFGVAGACKAFALLPFVVLVGQLVLSRKEPLRRTGLVLGSAAGAFVVICSPFLLIAPGSFVQQVVVTQLQRRGAAMSSSWARLAQFVGAPPAPTSPVGSSAVSPFEHGVIAAVALLAGGAVLTAWRAGGGPGLARSSLARYSGPAVVVTAIGLAWPAAFYYHYAAFLAPFLAITFGIAAERVVARAAGRSCSLGPRALTALGAGALLVVGTAHATRVVQVNDQPFYPGTSLVAKVVPPAACAITDEPSALLLANRFLTRAGCDDLVDADGSTLAWSGGRASASAAAMPVVVQRWEQVFARTNYLVLSGGLRPGRIPWGPQLRRYLRSHFREVAHQGGLEIFARY